MQQNTNPYNFRTDGVPQPVAGEGQENTNIQYLGKSDNGEHQYKVHFCANGEETTVLLSGSRLRETAELLAFFQNKIESN